MNIIYKKLLEKIDPSFTKPKYTGINKRDPQWPALSKKMIKEAGNKCALCNKSKNLITHHIIPVHVNKELELNENNLIVLCEHLTHNCHFFIAHCCDWRSYNPEIRIDTKLLNERILNRKYKGNK